MIMIVRSGTRIRSMPVLSLRSTGSSKRTRTGRSGRMIWSCSFKIVSLIAGYILRVMSLAILLLQNFGLTLYLIALLQIIFMGRRKFYMSNKQHGRNMIISEYIWHRWLATQPNPELINKILDDSLPDKDPNKYHPMYRKRKQVSSHIQVQKSFFKYHPACELSIFLFNWSR